MQMQLYTHTKRAHYRLFFDGRHTTFPRSFLGLVETSSSIQHYCFKTSLSPVSVRISLRAVPRNAQTIEAVMRP